MMAQHRRIPTGAYHITKEAEGFQPGVFDIISEAYAIECRDTRYAYMFKEAVEEASGLVGDGQFDLHGMKYAPRFLILRRTDNTVFSSDERKKFHDILRETDEKASARPLEWRIAENPRFEELLLGPGA